MEENGQDKILAFDTLYTNNHIQKLKILSGYLHPATQKKMAVYIKYMELQHAIRLSRQLPLSPSSAAPEHMPDIAALCEEILPFCSLREQEMLRNLQNMIKNYENMQEMLQMVEMMQEIMPEGFSPEGGMGGMSGMSGIDITQILNMMGGAATPEPE